MKFKARIEENIKEALQNLSEGPYIHSRSIYEFNYLKKKLEDIGFRGAGNIDVREDPLNRKIWHRANYDVVRTLGFSSSGEPLQDYKGISGNDYTFFFIRPREAA